MIAERKVEGVRSVGVNGREGPEDRRIDEGHDPKGYSVTMLTRLEATAHHLAGMEGKYGKSW